MGALLPNGIFWGKNTRADKWYALVWCYVCPLTWLKIIKLCPCLSHFSGFFGHFESLAFFFQNGGTNLTPKQSNMIFWSIFERYNNKVTIFQKSQAILTKNWEQTKQQIPIEGFFNKKLLNCGKIVAFWTEFWGQRWQHWYVDDQNYD